MKRCIGASHSNTGASCLPSLVAPWEVESGKRDCPSFTEHSAVPILQTQRQPPHPPSVQHDLVTASLSPVLKATVNKEMLPQDFFPLLFFLLPSPNQTFSPPHPWHKMVKWCSTAEFNFTVQLGPWLHCQIQINVHLTNMDQGNSGWQPAVIGAIDSCVEFYAPSTPAYHWWNWLIKWIHCYNYL